ncbi:MAG: hypothetical protein CM1200mP10_14510 [Candidatus Neomarinimicrobiota bacterium]|nr:MAG: hypothetical protein CM1200mP10_14510 [Candidatus Neomarinimicrobiota bacterium]
MQRSLGKKNPVNTSAPYVNAGASTAANALALMDTPDWKWKMNFSSGTVSNKCLGKSMDV